MVRQIMLTLGCLGAACLVAGGCAEGPEPLPANFRVVDAASGKPLDGVAMNVAKASLGHAGNDATEDEIRIAGSDGMFNTVSIEQRDRVWFERSGYQPSRLVAGTGRVYLFEPAPAPNAPPVPAAESEKRAPGGSAAFAQSRTVDYEQGQTITVRLFPAPAAKATADPAPPPRPPSAPDDATLRAMSDREFELYVENVRTFYRNNPAVKQDDLDRSLDLLRRMRDDAINRAGATAQPLPPSDNTR